MEEYTKGNNPQKAYEFQLKTQFKGLLSRKKKVRNLFTIPIPSLQDPSKSSDNLCSFSQWVLQYGEGQYFPPDETWDLEPMMKITHCAHRMYVPRLADMRTLYQESILTFKLTDTVKHKMPSKIDTFI